MNTKTSFQFRIREEAFEIMAKILRNPDVTGPEINGAYCRITANHDVFLGIQSTYWNDYKNDELVSVRILTDESRQFVVMKSLLEERD